MRICRYLNLTLPGLIFLVCFQLNLSAQGTIQVMVSGVPPVLSSPFISAIEQNYHMGQYHIQVIYNNPDPVPVRFVFEIALSRHGEELFRITSRPVAFTPGNYFYRTFDDAPLVRFTENPLDYISTRLQEQVVREGVIPEGEYMLEVGVICVDPYATVTSIPSYTHFEVRFPQPPVLMAPVDGGNASPVFPVFSWTPVIGIPMFQFDYEVLIVEVLRGQTPLQAIQSNREHARISTRQPLMIYTSEYLPLESGRQYAWQVRANEINALIPLSDNGLTEIFTFSVGEFIGDFDRDQLDRIMVVPGFAELVNLDQLDFITGTHSFTLNGFATLQLDFAGNGAGTVEIDVYCQDLEIQVGDIENPVILGGYIDGNIRGQFLPVQGAGEIVSIERIEWSLTEGLTADAKIIDPTGDLFEAEGRLNLSATGLIGTITATGPAGEPLFEYGEHPLELAVNSVTATFPGAFMTADAQLRFFNEPTPCIIPNMLITGDAAEFSASCQVEYAVPLVPGTDLATLYLGTANGNILIGGENPSFEYSFTIISSIRLSTLDGGNYNIPVTLEISSETGVNADIRAPPITYHFPDIDLGIAGMKILRVNDPYISYDPGTNRWDFGFEFDAGLRFPSLDDLQLPELYGITIDRKGIHFPPVHFDQDDLYLVPRLSLAGFGARLTSFTIPSFTFPWFDWDGNMPGPWDFEFDFELTFPKFPNHMPHCLRNLSLNVEKAGFSGGEFSAFFPSTIFDADECGFDIGAGYRLSLSRLEGGLTGIVEADEFSIDGHLMLDAAMVLGAPFACGDGTEVQLGADNFTMSSAGIISGEITGLIPACPISVGPYEAMVTASKLTFSAGNAGQAALFEADAYLEFPVQAGGTNQFAGELAIDLIAGELTALDFEIDEPFVWKVPASEEVLIFNIERARISLDGLMIHGRQEFMAGNKPIAVMFNELLLDLKTFRIKEGNILFDEAFAFEVGIDPNDFSLAYRSVAIDENLSLDPGVLFSLAGAVQIDAGGLRTAGSADAEIAFAGIQIGDLSVNFSDDFAFGLDPFRVRDGQIDVLYQENLLAVIDEFGFHPVLSFFDLGAVLPAHLPLPHTSVAYLVLKDEDDNFLLNVDDDPDSDLGVILGTRPGQSIDLVLPVLQGDLAEAPRVGVHFSGVKISLSPLRFESGQIEADVSGMAEFLDLEERFGIPFSLEQILYGNFDDFHDTFNEGLFFTGQLKLFEEQLGENAMVSLFVQQDGTLLTNFSVADLDRDIPLVPGSDIAVISINAISGHFQFPLLAASLPFYEFNIDGGFKVQYEENIARADISARYDRRGFHLLDFEYDISYKRPEINIDPFIFRIDEIRNLYMDYRRGEGFDFYAGLDLSFGMKVEEDTLLIPLRGIEIRPTGFNIPRQEINDGTDPRLMAPGITLFGIHLQPLAFEMDGADVDIYNFSPGDIAGLLPRIDFAITFPELAESFPDLAGLSLTVYQAGYSNGRFTGSVEVHNPLQPVRIPMGSTFLDVYEFAGNLIETTRDGQPVQGIDIFISGSVPGPDIFESDEPCDPVEFSLAIVQGRGFSGTVENFVPCGVIPIGQLSLTFVESRLEFEFEEGSQKVILAGGAELIIPLAGDQSQTATASGTIEMDILTGTLIDGSIEISDAFNWSLPAGAEEPFFTFVVNSARLDREGLTLRARGDMQVTEQLLVRVDFDDLVIGLDDFRIKDGQAVITTGYTDGSGNAGDGFAFELLFLPVKWRMVPSAQQVTADTNVIRLNLDGIGLILNKDGITFTGESTASVHLAQKLSEDGVPDEPEETDDPEQEDVKLEFPGLSLSFVNDFCFDWRTYAVTSGSAQLHRIEEDRDPLLLAWYDEHGLGLGDILGILPIPDTLGLPDRDIAYLVLRDTDPESPDYGDLVVEIISGDDGRTLRTKPGKSVKLVLQALEGEEGQDPPVFITEFSVTVNSAYEIVGGSIGVDLENNPFKVPALPVSLTGLSYERRENGVGALTASARLELPESLGGLEVNMDELRFSSQGFEQVTFSVGDPVSNADTLSSLVLADSALIINLFYATASFGEERGFGIRGTLESNLFGDENGDEETEGLSFIPFESIYGITEALDQEWRFMFDLDRLQRDSIAISHARLWLTEAGAVASREEFTVSLSGTISLPELLGDDFSVTVNELTLGTNGISVGGVEVQASRQEFSLFEGRVIIGVDQVRPDYNNETRVLYMGFDGFLEVLERRADFTNLVIGTDGSFAIGDAVDINLLKKDETIDLIPGHLVLTGLIFGITEENLLRLTVQGDATLPEPFAASSDFSVTIAQTEDRVNIIPSGPNFRFDEEGSARINFGDIATFALTAAALDIDFSDVSNTTFYASAELHIHSDSPDDDDTPKLIRFGESTNIKDDGRHGLRYNYADGLSWHITETFAPSEEKVLFGFSVGFFSIDIMMVTMPEDEPGFVVEIAGSAGLNLPKLKGTAGFEGFRISSEPDYVQFGRFTGGLSADLMDVVKLSLGNFRYESFDEPYPITLIEDEDEPDPDNPSTRVIHVMEYLLVENAGITLNGKGGNGNGTAGNGAKDTYGGEVERILFYRTEDGFSLQIEQAEITVPAASINVSMSYKTIGGFSLSVAGTGQFGFDETAVDLAVAGKISTINDELSFGLFVKAGVTPGIPIIPQVITLKGLGGGFYYNPREEDFNDVRRLAGLEYPAHPKFETPEYREGTRFAVFLYAAAGIIGDPEAAIDGEVFLEITDGATSLHVNAALFYQGERLKAFKSLHVTYGAGQDPMVQGLCSLAVDYQPALYGGAIIGFFAKPGPGDPPVLWAVYGESNINFFIVETSSDFIVCNDGLLANFRIDASLNKLGISVEGNLLASVWYYHQTQNIGAYGEVSAMVSAYGASVNATLMGALISTRGERFFYAQGEVNIDVIVADWGGSAYVSYSTDGWDAGWGTNPEFQQMIADARVQAESIEQTARQAAEDVDKALAALRRAEFMKGLMEDIDVKIQDYAHIEQKRNSMNEKIAYVTDIGGEISDRLRSTIDHTADLRDYTEVLARELQNPLTWDRGTVTGNPEKLEVSENPTITVDQSVSQRNEADLLEYMQESIEVQMEQYEDAIAKTLQCLRELEMTIEGESRVSHIFLDACVNVLGSSFENRIGFSTGRTVSPTVDSPVNYTLPGTGFGGLFNEKPGRGPMAMFTEQLYPVQSGLMLSGNSAAPNFHYLSENYTGAVEVVKDFYSAYILAVYSWRSLYILELISLGDDPEKIERKNELKLYIEAAENLIIEMEGTYDEIFPPLMLMHASFTASLDILYTLKAEITATLYGMVEEYFTLLAELPEQVAETSIHLTAPEMPVFEAKTSFPADFSREDASSELASLRIELVQMLEPPVISSLVVTPGDPGLGGVLFTARNWADIQWQANHPLFVAETSYLIEPSSDGAGQGQFTSAGKLESFRHYTWRKASSLMAEDEETPGSSQERENMYNISLRARGSGGNTTIRSTTVSLRVRPGGTSTPAGEQLHDDVSSPSAPTVELPSYRSVLSATSPVWEPELSVTGGSFGTSGTGALLENIYYTSDGARISLSITAHDEHSDIRKFEYALGSYPGGVDIVDWKEAVGVTSHIGAGGSGVTRRMETVIRGLSLEHQGMYYISARVTNSAGKSSEFSMSDPLVYDSTPPSAPGAIEYTQSFGTVTSLQSFDRTISINATPVQYPVVTEAPPFEPGIVNYPSSYLEPSITRGWKPAEDPESGIWGYEYVLTPIESATDAFFLDEVNFITTTQVTITGPPVSYTEPLYLHVRSRNNAGNLSTSYLTYGPLMLDDPSAPTAPRINVKVGSGVVLYIPYLSGDFESQVIGYQYSVGSSPGAADIRDWGPGIDIDHPWEISGNPVTGVYSINPVPDEVPRHHIPSVVFPAIATGDMYVNIRAVNGQNMFSPVVASGPFRYDTRPDEPLIEHDFNRRTGELVINIGNIFDSGVPVSSVRYRVRDIATGRTVQDWTNVNEFTGGKFTSPRGVTTTTSVGTEVGTSGLAVEVQVTNSMGKNTNATMYNTTGINQMSPMKTGLTGTTFY